MGGSDLVGFCLGADGRDDGVTVVLFYSRVSTELRLHNPCSHLIHIFLFYFFFNCSSETG